MPTAPIPQRQMVDAPVPNVRIGAVAPPEYYGSGIADTVASAGVRMYDLENRAANQTAVFEADRSLADKQTELENQLYNVKGKQVLGADKAMLEAYDQHVEQTAGTLSNNNQRGAFQHTAALRRQQLNETAQKYIRTEYGNFQDQETTATIKSSQDRVRQNPDRPDILTAEFTRAAAAVNALSERKGWSGPVTQEMVNDPAFRDSYEKKGLVVPAVGDTTFSSPHEQAFAQVYSKMHEEVINGFLAQDQDQKAADHFKKYKVSMTASDLDAVEKNVAEGSTRGESRRLVGSLIAKYGAETPEQQKQVLDEIRKLPDSKAKVADLAEQRALHVFSVGKEQRSEAYTNGFMTMSKQMDQTWQQHPQVKFARDMYAPNVWSSLKPEDQQALEVKLSRLRNPVTDHDPLTWFKLQSMTPEQIAKIPPQRFLADYLNHFDPSHYDRGSEIYNQAISMAAKGEKDPKNISALTNKDRIMNGWMSSGISKDPSKMNAQEKVWYNTYETEADKALNALPKDAPTEQIDKTINAVRDSLLKQKYQTPGMFGYLFGGNEVPAVAVPGLKDKDNLRIKIDQIPAASQEQIKGLLNVAGKPVTTDKLERIYAIQSLHRNGQMEKEAAKAAMKAIILE